MSITKFNDNVMEEDSNPCNTKSLTDNKLKFSFVERFEIVLRNDLIEAALKSKKLLFDSAAVAILNVQLHVVLLVVFSHLDLLASALQLVQADCTISCVLDCKSGAVQDTLDIVGQDPLE